MRKVTRKGEYYYTLKNPNGTTTKVTYEIGEIIRWPKNGCNMLKAKIVEDRGNDWLVVDRHGKQHLAWKGCVSPLKFPVQLTDA